MSPPTIINWETDETWGFKPVVSAVRKKQLILFPTDTVYGIGGMPREDVAGEMIDVKGRAPEKKFPILAGESSQVEKMAADIPLRARILMAKFWPGALTLALPAKKDIRPSLCAADGTLAFRIPAHKRLREMLSLIGPIVSTSANRSGQPDAGRFDDLDPKILARVGVAIRDDRRSCKIASTVVSVQGDRIHVARQGAIPPEMLTDPLNVLFICAGNTCRSPMAAGIARKEFEPLGDLAVVNSRGLSTRYGLPPSDTARRVCDEIEIDIGLHQSAPLTPEDIAAADIIFTMEYAQRMLLLALFPSRRDRIHTLREYATGVPGPDVSDPIGGDVETYRRCCDEISILVKKTLRRLLGSYR